MRNYIKYKNFLPRNYIDENIKKNKKSNKKAIWLLVALNLYMLPINVMNIINRQESDSIVAVNYEKNNNDKFIQEIGQWIKLNEFKIESLEAEGEQGIIKTNDKDILGDIEKEGYKILSVTKEDNMYKANVSKGD